MYLGRHKARYTGVTEFSIYFIINAIYLKFLSSKSTFAASKTIRVARHAHTSSAGLTGTVLTLSDDLSFVIHLVELEYCKLHGLVLVMCLLRLAKNLLLSLLSTTT